MDLKSLPILAISFFFFFFIKTHARHHYETLKSQLVDTPNLNYAITRKSLTKTKKKELKKHWGTTLKPILQENTPKDKAKLPQQELTHRITVTLH